MKLVHFITYKRRTQNWILFISWYSVLSLYRLWSWILALCAHAHETEWHVHATAGFIAVITSLSDVMTTDTNSCWDTSYRPMLRHQLKTRAETQATNLCRDNRYKLVLRHHIQTCAETPDTDPCWDTITYRPGWDTTSRSVLRHQVQTCNVLRH